ncbi:MAG: tetratricopeptide repeat protein, partial [Pyrinomonadaceae bacterium]
RKCVQLMPDSALPMYVLCFALVKANRRGEAQEVLDDLLKMSSEKYVKEYFIALAHVALGNYDAAFSHLEKAFAEKEPWLTWFGTDSKLDPLRGDPRFMELFRSTNNPLAS